MQPHIAFDDDSESFEVSGKSLGGPKKESFEVDYKVHGPQDIQQYQNELIDETAMIIGQPPESCAILLRNCKWNKEKLIEDYMDREAKVLEEVGLDVSSDEAPKISTIPGFQCDICFSDDHHTPTYAMRCGHRFCTDCYKQYLYSKIKDEGEAARIKCPGEGCNRIVDSRTLDMLISDDLRDRYERLLMRTYVDDKEKLKWCPAPNCEYTIECGIKQKDLSRIVPTVRCLCGFSSCFGCSLPDHLPAPCALVKMWLKKCEDDSETANWISANTKECPKCNSTIEKNGGCNHMTCRKCRHEFCWMCMGVWSEHGTSWYACNRYEERSGLDARDAQAKSRQSLERYLHYYNRYANHEQSAKLDKDIALKAEKKMQNLQVTSGLSWIEVQFLDTASHVLQECRQTLKWTYAFAYYLAKNNKTTMFEDNQKDLELAVENLSEMFEKPTEELSKLKVDIMDKISYCTKRRVILLRTTADELKTGKGSPCTSD